MFVKIFQIVLVALFAVFVTVDSLVCYSCAGPRDSPCYLGNATSSQLVNTTCPAAATHCYATSATTVLDSTMQRGCSIGCINPNATTQISYSTTCCNWNSCNAVGTIPNKRDCYSCITTSTSPSDACYSGNPSGLQSMTCPTTSTHCSTTTSIFNGVTTTSRGCHANCVNSPTTKCCSPSYCNKVDVVQTPLQCYQCSTTSNATTDACFTGDTSNPIMNPITCDSGAINCYKESTDYAAYTLTVRGCRSSTCSSNGCISCSTSLCNGALSTSGSTLTGFIVLVVVGVYSLF